MANIQSGRQLSLRIENASHAQHNTNESRGQIGFPFQLGWDRQKSCLLHDADLNRRMQFSAECLASRAAMTTVAAWHKNVIRFEMKIARHCRCYLPVFLQFAKVRAAERNIRESPVARN